MAADQESPAPSMKERMRRGELYRGDDPELSEELLSCQERMAAFNAIPARSVEARQELLSGFLAEFGEEAEIRSPFYFDWGDGISVGARTFINYNAAMLDGAPITIGEECLLASGVTLATATHPIDPETRRAAWELAAPITLADGVWLGAGVIVCPGVSIGENTVVGAGAVVTRDLPAGVVAVGNPARVLREIGEEDRLSPPAL